MTTFEVRGRHGIYTVESAPISKGGVGSIHRTTDPKWVYKKYFVPAKAPTLLHLDRLISIGRDVLIRDGRMPGDTPESSVNWPVDVSLDGTGEVQGVLLPTIPPLLFNEFGTVRGLEFLVMARANPPPAKGRISLLLRMAEILNFVDSRGLVHGDINGKNLAWTVSPAPVMYLIDCDGMVPQMPPPTQGVQAMGWADPRVIDSLNPAHDQYSDWYALALAMYRGLLLTPGKLDSRQTDGSWPKPQAIPADLDAAIAALLRRGLSDPLNPDSRPRPAEWVQGLIDAFLENGRFNDDATRKLDKLSATITPAKPAFTQLPPTNWPQLLPRRTVPQPPWNRPAPPRQNYPPQQPYMPQQSSTIRFNRPRRLVKMLVVLAVIGVISIVANAALSRSHANSIGAPATEPSSAASTPNGPTGSTAVGPQDQATQVDQLLQKSKATRKALGHSYDEVANCSDVTDGLSGLQQVASQRNSEITEAQALQTGDLANGAELQSDLIKFLQDSLAADNDFVTWAQDESSSCTSAANDEAYNAGMAESGTAVSDKNSFLSLWDSIAQNQGLVVMTQADL